MTCYFLKTVREGLEDETGASLQINLSFVSVVSSKELRILISKGNKCIKLI